MSQPIENKLLDLQGILQILRNQAQSLPVSSTSSRYLRALDSLQASIASESLAKPQRENENFVCPLCETPNREAGLSQGDSRYALRTTHHAMRAPLANWLVNLWLTATPFSTASLYLDIISSLYNSAAKAGLLPKTTLFSQLKADLKSLGTKGWKSGIDDEIFDRALRLTRNAAHLIADDHTAAQMVIWSLTHNLVPLDQVAMLKKSDIGPLPKSLDSWFLTLDSSKRKQYLFPLQNRSQRHVAKIVNDLFRRARLPQATDPYQTVEALWAYAALRTGIPASTLVSHLGHAPLGLPILKLCVDSFAFCENRTDLQSAASESHYAPRTTHHDEYFSYLGKIFIENPPQWYAMSLRPGVRFTQICRRIQLLQAPSPLTLHSSPLAEGLQLFYPSEEITRAIGKKIVTRQRPFIHSVVFFRAKLTDIGRLFARIGDLAWCYRQSARPGAPYAAISDTQFRQFQQTIAQFTPDYEVAPAGELKLNEGDRVEILGGLFTGHQATILDPHAKPQRKNAPSAASEASRSRSSLPEESVLDKKNSASSRENNSQDAPRTTQNTIYRLSIIGDNGIEWRITSDSRLLKPQTPNPSSSSAQEQ